MTTTLDAVRINDTTELQRHLRPTGLQVSLVRVETRHSVHGMPYKQTTLLEPGTNAHREAAKHFAKKPKYYRLMATFAEDKRFVVRAYYDTRTREYSVKAFLRRPDGTEFEYGEWYGEWYGERPGEFEKEAINAARQKAIELTMLMNHADLFTRSV